MPRYLQHHLKLHHLHFTEINALYISLSLHSFSTGLIGIFVPIYIYNLGFPVSHLALYFILMGFTYAASCPLGARMVNRFGPKHVIALSYLLQFYYVLLLYLLQSQPQVLYPAAVIGGITAALFWMARHIDLSTVIDTHKPTNDYSRLLTFLAIAEALAPLFGGFIATMFGFTYVLLGTSIGLILAILPLVKILEPVIQKKTHLQILRTAPAKHLVANFAINIQSIVAAFLWPFFIFLIVKTYQNVGIIASVSLILIVVLLKFLGRMKKQKKITQLLKTGSYMRLCIHIIRTFSQSFLAVLGTNILGDITDILISVPYAVRYYAGARTYNIPSYLTDMEIIAGFGQIIPWFVLLLTSMVFDLKTSLIITFILAAIAMPFLRLIEPLRQSQ